MFFDTLSEIELEEAKKAKDIIKNGGSLRFMFEIRNNPEKYPNLSQFKNDILRVLHDEFRNNFPKQDLINPDLIRPSGDFEMNEQNRMDREEMQEFANSNKVVKNMKINLSKSQWESIGRKYGWIKTAQPKLSYFLNNYIGKLGYVENPIR